MTVPGLIVEWALPTLFVLPLALLIREPGAGTALARAIWRRRWPLFVATRVLYPVLLYLVLDLSFASDWWAWKRNVFWMERGLLPGVGLENLYGPLFCWLQYGGALLTPGVHWVGAAIPFVVGDLAAVFLGARCCGRYREWAGAWLLLTPLLWHQLVVRGQDESMFAGALAGALLAVQARRPMTAAAVLAVGLCATKLTFAPYAGAALLALGLRDPRPALLFAGTTAAVYGLYAWTGAPILDPGNLGAHCVNYGAGISVTDLLARLWPDLPRDGALGAYVVVTGAAVLATPWLARRLDVPRRMVLALAAVHAASMLSMPFCVFPYFTQGIVPVLALLALFAPGGRAGAAFLLLLPVCAWLVVMDWSGSRWISAPLLVLSIAFHGLLLARAISLAAGRDGGGAT